MKCLSLVVRASVKQDLVDKLQSIPEVSGYTILQGEGHSTRTTEDSFETTRDAVVGYVPRVRLDLVLADDDVDKVLSQLRSCDICSAGRGAYWLTPVEAWGRL